MTCTSDTPIIRYSNLGTKTYKLNGVLHRVFGPAVQGQNGRECWWRHGKRHREGGPAEITTLGTVAYWVNDHLHRTDGPAVIYKSGATRYYLNGKQLSKENWEKKLERNKTSQEAQ